MSRQILLKDRIIQAAVAIIEAGGTPTFSTISRRLGSRSQALLHIRIRCVPRNAE